jgi:hypothetical protein
VEDALEVVEEARGESRNPLNAWVAIAVVILASFMAISAVKGDNLAQAMAKAKAEEVNAWNYYQAKSTKQNIAEVAQAQLELEAVAAQRADPEAARQIRARAAQFGAEVARYEGEKKEIFDKATALGMEYEQLNFHDDQFDLSDAVLSLSLALLGMAALTEKRWLFWTAVGLSAFGLFMGINAWFRFGFAPEALTRLLG